MPVSVSGSQTTSLTSLAFNPASLISPVLKSSNCQFVELDSSSKEYCDTENSATVPLGFGFATPRVGALSITLERVSTSQQKWASSQHTLE